MVDVLRPADRTRPATSARRTAGATVRCPDRFRWTPRCRGHLPATSLAPLGYTAAPDRQRHRPNLLAGPADDDGRFAFAAVGPRGPYLVVPMFAGLIVWTTFVLGRRIGGVAVGAMATLFVVREPDRALSVALADDRRADRRAVDGVAAVSRSEVTWSPALSGLIAAVLSWSAPNLPLVTLVFVLHFLLDGPTWRAGLIRAATFAVLVAPAVIAVAALNARWYGSPFNSGYGSAGQLYSFPASGRTCSGIRYGWCDRIPRCRFSSCCHCSLEADA